MICDFIQDYDIYGSEAFYVKDKSINELLEIASRNNYVVAFNTLGYFKNDANDLVYRPNNYTGKVGGVFIIKDRIEPSKEFDPSVFTVYTFDGLKKRRYGENGDGGYVISNNKIKYDLLVGCGIDDRCKFEEDFSSAFNVDVHCFDGTIKDMPRNKIQNMTFHNINIGPENIEGKTTNLSSLLSEKKEVFLKMDIEGHEYPFFDTITDENLDRIAQMTVEFHGVANSSFGFDIEMKNRVYAKLNKHFVIIHAHGNNNSFRYKVGETLVPNVMELTFINKRHVTGELKLNEQALPCPILDHRCSTINADYSLNYKPFVN